MKEDRDVDIDLPHFYVIGGLQLNLKPFVASDVLGECLDQQRSPENVMLSTSS